MASLYVDALFKNILSDETIDICINGPFQNPKTSVRGISQNDFCDLLKLTTK